MKRSLGLALLFLTVVAPVAVACAAINRTAPPYVTPSVSPRVEIAAQPTQRSTVTVEQDVREDLIRQIRAAAEQYSDLVRIEESEGNLRTATATSDSEPAFQFVDPSDSPLYQAWDDAVGQIQALNEDYAARFWNEFDRPTLPLPVPRPVDQGEIQQRIDAAGSAYVSWLDEESTAGSTVVMFDPYELRYQSILIGDSFIRERLRWSALLEYRLELLTPPLDQRRADIDVIQRVFPGDVRLEDVGVLMPMYTDHELHQYHAGDWLVLIDPTDHRIVWIDRETQAGGRHEPQSESSPVGGLTPEELERKAVEFIRLVAPSVDLASLTPVPNQKGQNHFFRWEDRTKPLLPDGRSCPFIQVALSGTGDLLNYYNTL